MTYVTRNMKIDYKNTVFLPKTDFSMRGDLVEKEPKMAKKWQDMGLYQRLLKEREGKEKFILHDGPPYANGQIHLGTALNKILKDMANRVHLMLGKYVPYVPGWDCHGLPIEWKIEEEYRKAGKNKDDVPVVEFRKECREFAKKWIDIQREEFKRLGVLGDWDNPYFTMSAEAVATVVEELGKFLLEGSLYKGFKPVMWSVVEQTALAEMEVEYQDKTSNSIYVKFPLQKTPIKELENAAVVIWTTTPWTIPANRAICYGPDFDYICIEFTEIPADSLLKAGEKIVIAKDLCEPFMTQLQAKGKIVREFKGVDLEGSACRHPFKAQGYDFVVPLLPGEHVTLEAGTGLVHTAPSHGEDDFKIGKAYNLEIPDLLSDNGIFRDQVPLFAGIHVFKADEPVMEKLKEVSALLYHVKIVHSYPHSWRSKAPLIFRTTPQWFVSMEKTGLRSKAMKAIAATRWIPAHGQNRIEAMIASRPDWCLSRQRVWGVPITLFLHKHTGELLKDAKVHARIVEAFKQHGADIWYEKDPLHFLEPDYDPNDYEAARDILDVWFDSGSSHAFVLEKRPELQAPADLYLEGSDQHRGWFHSSLLESCGTRGVAPYKAVLTHGFVLDAQGRKMSKSLGNTILPQDITQEMGAEILRLWIVNSDFVDDIRIGKETLKHQQDVYRRLRNTLRYLLGALEGFDEAEKVDYSQLPDIEKWVLHKVHELQRSFIHLSHTYEFQKFYSELHSFCSVDLSAYYFDIRKDTLYCDLPTHIKRRAARSTFDILFNYLIRWLSPALCFTAEEAYLSRGGNKKESLSLETLPSVPEEWKNEEIAKKVEGIRDIKRLITGALELKRAEGAIGSSLQAKVTLYDPQSRVSPEVDWAEQAIVSCVNILSQAVPKEAFIVPDLPNLGAIVEEADGEKCERCWQILPDVGSQPHLPDICGRCVDAVEKIANE